MITRRGFVSLASLPLLARPSQVTSKARVERALAGQSVDRSPFTFWYHFVDEKESGAKHAESTLAFHRKFKTDLVKVMSDYAYPKPSGGWLDARETTDPFPEQIRALELIRDGLKNQVPFLETLFNPWNVAEKLSSKDEVAALAASKPQALANVLEVIAKSQAHHARRAIKAGASGIFLAIANSSRPDYAKLSEPYDKLILEAARTAPMNTLHIHGDTVDLDRFLTGWPASILNYSSHGTGIALDSVRKKFSGLMLGGIDERNYRTLGSGKLREQWNAAKSGCGAKFVLAPGCSVPNETSDAEMLALTKLVAG